MAKVGNITGKVLIQIGDNDPVEVGTVEIPVNVDFADSAKPALRMPTTTPPIVMNTRALMDAVSSNHAVQRSAVRTF